LPVHLSWAERYDDCVRGTSTATLLLRSCSGCTSSAGVRDVTRAAVEPEAGAALRRFDRQAAHVEGLLDSRRAKGGR
jgi:hypothetical protein